MAISTKPGDLQFSSLLSGAYGSAAIALFFLIADAIRGDVLFTPSFMGQIVLFGTLPADVTATRLDAVALYSLAHLFAFVCIGTAVTFVYAKTSIIPRNAIAVSVAVLAVLTVGTMGVDRLIFPGIIDGIGRVPLALGNGFASIVMAVLISHTFEGTILNRKGEAAQRQNA